MANGVKAVVLDYEAGLLENLRKVNVKSYFRDTTRPELQHTASIEDASMLVVAIDNKEAAKELVHYVKHTYPKVTVLARAFDKGHSYELRHAGADETVNETYHSALQLGVVAMKDLGIHPFYVEQKLLKSFSRNGAAKGKNLIPAIANCSCNWKAILNRLCNEKEVTSMTVESVDGHHDHLKDMKMVLTEHSNCLELR